MLVRIANREDPDQTDYSIHAVNFSKIQTLLFLFSNDMLVFRAVTRLMLVRIANREDPDQTDYSIHMVNVRKFQTFFFFCSQ